MAEHYRTGRRNHRVIYLQVGSEPSDDDVMVGSFDTAQLARLFVDSVNRRVSGDHDGLGDTFRNAMERAHPGLRNG